MGKKGILSKIFIYLLLLFLVLKSYRNLIAAGNDYQAEPSAMMCLFLGHYRIKSKPKSRRSCLPSKRRSTLPTL